MKTLITFTLLLFSLTLSAAETVHSHSAKDIDGKELKLDKFKGKTLLIVNVASKCGLTPQYKQLQELHDKYAAKGLKIIAFPANNFGRQEPGNEKAIKEFCSSKFGVTFQMMSKIDVKGQKQHALYKHLTSQPGFDGEISWNFEKFLISADGKVAARFKPRTKPDSKKVVAKIEELLKK